MIPRTWVIQISGLLLLMAMLVYAMPKLTGAVSGKLESDVRGELHKAGLGWASVRAEGRNITINGSTLSPDEHQQAIQLAKSVWLVKKVDDEIKPVPVRPYWLSLKKSAGRLEINGFLPSEDDKEKIRKLRQQVFKGGNVVGNVKTGVGAPAAWVELTQVLLKEISKLDLAYANLSGQSLEITGRALTTPDVEAVRKTLQPFTEKGYQINVDLVAADHAKVVCQQKFNELLSSEKIYFETGKAIIDHKSDQLLQKLTDNAIFCANSKITIIGHTDNVGSETDNQELSFQRAKAVKGALFTLGGISTERLDAIGKGSAESVDTNDTEEGRAKNRRIEFIVEDMK